MDTNIEWLFDEVYRIKKNKEGEINFISDWDISINNNPAFQAIIHTVYKRSAELSSAYRYAYEQFALKEKIIDNIKIYNGVHIEQDHITFTPSATISINLVLKAIKACQIKRVLVITPAYFSMHDTLKDIGLEPIYYHLTDRNNLKINFLELATLMDTQLIEALIITDPIYSAGIELSLDEMLQLKELCNINDAYLIVDYSLGGLLWGKTNGFTFNYEKLAVLRQCKHILIDTLTKRLLLNGIKFSVLIGSKEIIDKIDIQSEFVFGALGTIQCQLMNEFYDPVNQKTLDHYCESNIRTFIDSYRLIETYLTDTPFYLSPTNTGYFTCLNSQDFILGNINTKKFCLYMLKKKKILCLSKDRFSFFHTNNFGIRLNLNKPLHLLLEGIRECIRVDYSRFNIRD